MAWGQLRHVSRRVLLQRSAAVAALGSAALISERWPQADAGLSAPSDVTMHRLSTRNTRSCSACQAHHRSKVFLTAGLADANRAHPSCNCPITEQQLSAEQLRSLVASPTGGEGVWDLRHL